MPKKSSVSPNNGNYTIIQNMGKLKQTLLTLVIGATLVGCATPHYKALIKVQPGMTQTEIMKLFGQPKFRRFDAEGEEWEYQKSSVFGNRKYLIIEFKDGKVIALDSFDSFPARSTDPAGYHTCSAFSTKEAPRDDEFQQLYEKVKSSVFKESTLERSIFYQSFTCKQCIKLMSLYTFDDDKLKILKVLVGHISDKGNYNDIVDSLDFISSKEKARSILGMTD